MLLLITIITFNELPLCSFTIPFLICGFMNYTYNEAEKSMSRTNVEGYDDRSYTISNPQAGDLVFFLEHIKPVLLIWESILETMSSSRREPLLE